MSKNKKKKWIRFRHKIARNIIYAIVLPLSRLKYGMRIKRFREQEKRPYFILYNHQTPFDQFFVGVAFKGAVYYVASEDIFSNGWVSSVIRYLVAPIPIKKHTTDVRAILTCMQIAKEGGSIAIAPEGNRTYSGKTEYMSPAIAPLARKMGLPIALFRIEGGYGVQPRWSDVVRKGKSVSYVSRVIKPEEYANMTDDELFTAIKEGLYVNEAVADARFIHKKSAEYLERAIYVCPKCGLSEFESSNDTVTCKKCSLSVKYTDKKELVSSDSDFKFGFVSDWYDYQSNFINSLDTRELADTRIYKDACSFFEVVPYKKKSLISDNAELSLYGDKMEISFGGELLSLSFSDISGVSILGRNKLNVCHGGKLYQFKGSKRFCALKYIQIYHRHMNIAKGDTNGKFLGL